MIAPAVQPSFFLDMDVAVQADIVGLHVGGVPDGGFEFVNFDWALQSLAGGESRARAILKIDLNMDEGQTRPLVLVDAEGQHHFFAHVHMSEGFCSLSSANPVICTIVDMLSHEHMPLVPIFIGGAAKSGTTWAEAILNAHPAAIVTGENAFWDWPLSIFNQDLLPQLGEEWFIRRASVTTRPFTNAISMMGYGRAELTFRQLAALTGLAFVGDKSPGNSFHAAEILMLFPRGHFVQCYRHPLDVVVSRANHEALIIKNAVDRQKTADIVSILPRRIRDVLIDSCDWSMEEAVESIIRDDEFIKNVLDDWLSSNFYAGRAKVRYPDRVHFLCYEYLNAFPRDTLAHLLGELAMPVTDDLIGEIVQSTSFEKMSGGRSAGIENSESFFRNGISGDFTNYFDRRQVSVVRKYLSDRSSFFLDQYFAED